MSTLDLSSASIAPAERRERPRITARQQLTFDFYSDDGHKLGVGLGVTVNVSEAGLLLATDKWLEPGMRVLVEIVTALYMFMATARVVHSQQIGDTLFQVGVRYDQIIQSDWSLAIGAKSLAQPPHIAQESE